MKFQQAAMYINNSNLNNEKPSLSVKRVKSSYIRNKSKLSGIFQENLIPENAVCSKILIKEKILCCKENNNNLIYNNLCFEDCPNLNILKRLEKDLKDLIESNVNLKKMNEYLLKTISIKDYLFIDAKNENKNLKVDNNILNSHIGSKRILSGRQCQIRNRFKSSFAFELPENTQNPSNSSLNPKKGSQSVISGNTLNNFYISKSNLHNFSNPRNNHDNGLVSSSFKKKRKESGGNSISNSKEVVIGEMNMYGKSNNLNTFLSLASKQKKKNSGAINCNYYKNKVRNIEFVNDFSSKVSFSNNNNNNNKDNNNWNSHLKNLALNASSIIQKNNSTSIIEINNNNNILGPNFNNSNINSNLNPNNNYDNNLNDPNIIINNNNNEANNQSKAISTGQFSRVILASKQSSQEASPHKHKRDSISSTISNQINNNTNNNKNSNLINNKNIININNTNNNNNSLTSSCGPNNTKEKNFYEQISSLVAKNNNKNLKFKNKARSSLLGLNDEMLSKIISNEVILNLKKITLNDEEFIDFFRTTGEDKLISYCDAIYQLIRDLESAIKLIQRMRSYIIVTASLANYSLLEEIASFIIKDACKIMDCDRTSIFLYDNLSDMLVVNTGEGLTRNEIRVPKNLGIIGSVFLKGKIIRVDDAYADPRFNKDFDLKSNYVTKNILGAPLKDSSGVTFGVIQSINKNSNMKFTDDDEEFIHLFSLHISQILKSAKTNDQNISYIAMLKMIIAFKEDVLIIENLIEFASCIEQIIMNIFSTQYSQILIYNEPKNNLVKISKYENSEKNKSIGIVGYVFEKKEYFGISSCNGCQFYNNLIDIETGGMSIVTYPIISNGNVKAILQFAYNEKLIHFKKPKETDQQIIEYLLLDCGKWFLKNEEIVKNYFG